MTPYETRNAIISLVSELGRRDQDTFYHSVRIAKYTKFFYKPLELRKSQQRNLFLGALLHDIGKIKIPMDILSKPTRLTDAEFEVIKHHPIHGVKMLMHLKELHQDVIEIILYHHERMDGNGYPYGLKGEDIPLLSRVVSVIDAFDAMLNCRVYSNAQSFSYVKSEMFNNATTQFDVKVVTLFFKAIQEGGAIHCNMESLKSEIPFLLNRLC
jgi:putative nucleotidyltransferase with HDIG domain